MTINVTMSKEEFLDYCKYSSFKSNIKCGIINLESIYDNLCKELLESGNMNNCRKIMNEFSEVLKTLKEANLS